ncbi:hypothetical protein XENOCAPTIV_021350 [Xenoophorus captivus]|uniref:Uncharacterized protein n=1 Tax=Xenoophorus captivus TaxID=1517983 RepID=A0ABV0QNQ9_9TELE
MFFLNQKPSQSYRTNRIFLGGKSKPAVSTFASAGAKITSEKLLTPTQSRPDHCYLGTSTCSEMEPVSRLGSDTPKTALLGWLQLLGAVQRFWDKFVSVGSVRLTE